MIVTKGPLPHRCRNCGHLRFRDGRWEAIKKQDGFCSDTCRDAYQAKRGAAYKLFEAHFPPAAFDRIERVVSLHRMRVGSANARAKRLGATGRIQWHEWVELLALSPGVCGYCEEYVGLEMLGVDHIVPISRGGSNTIENIAASCVPCNFAKGVQTGAEFLERRKAA